MSSHTVTISSRCCVSGEKGGRGEVQLHVRQRFRVDVRDGLLRRGALVRAGTEPDANDGRQPIGRGGHRQSHVEQDFHRHHRRREHRRQR